MAHIAQIKLLQYIRKYGLPWTPVKKYGSGSPTSADDLIIELGGWMWFEINIGRP